MLAQWNFLHSEKRYCLWLKGFPQRNLKICRWSWIELQNVKKQEIIAVPQQYENLLILQLCLLKLLSRMGNHISLFLPIVRHHEGISLWDLSVLKLYPAMQFLSFLMQIFFHFGVLMSNVHNAWMRITCGRLKSDYRYSKEIVYNCFPGPPPRTRRKPKSSRPPRPFWTHGSCIRTAALPTCTMRSPCRQSCAAPTSKTTGQ